MMDMGLPPLVVAESVHACIASMEGTTPQPAGGSEEIESVEFVSNIMYQLDYIRFGVVVWVLNLVLWCGYDMCILL